MAQAPRAPPPLSAAARARGRRGCPAAARRSARRPACRGAARWRRRRSIPGRRAARSSCRTSARRGAHVDAAVRAHRAEAVVPEGPVQREGALEVHHPGHVLDAVRAVVGAVAVHGRGDVLRQDAKRALDGLVVLVGVAAVAPPGARHGHVDRPRALVGHHALVVEVHVDPLLVGRGEVHRGLVAGDHPHLPRPKEVALRGVVVLLVADGHRGLVGELDDRQPGHPPGGGHRASVGLVGRGHRAQRDPDGQVVLPVERDALEEPVAAQRGERARADVPAGLRVPEAGAARGAGLAVERDVHPPEDAAQQRRARDALQVFDAHLRVGAAARVGRRGRYRRGRRGVAHDRAAVGVARRHPRGVALGLDLALLVLGREPAVDRRRAGVARIGEGHGRVDVRGRREASGDGPVAEHAGEHRKRAHADEAAALDLVPARAAHVRRAGQPSLPTGPRTMAIWPPART
jgi:hypothetical protein